MFPHYLLVLVIVSLLAIAIAFLCLLVVGMVPHLVIVMPANIKVSFLADL